MGKPVFEAIRRLRQPVIAGLAEFDLKAMSIGLDPYRMVIEVGELKSGAFEKVEVCGNVARMVTRCHLFVDASHPCRITSATGDGWVISFSAKNPNGIFVKRVLPMAEPSSPKKVGQPRRERSEQVVKTVA